MLALAVTTSETGFFASRILSSSWENEAADLLASAIACGALDDDHVPGSSTRQRILLIRDGVWLSRTLDDDVGPFGHEHDDRTIERWPLAASP